MPQGSTCRTFVTGRKELQADLPIADRTVEVAGCDRRCARSDRAIGQPTSMVAPHCVAKVVSHIYVTDDHEIGAPLHWSYHSRLGIGKPIARAGAKFEVTLRCSQSLLQCRAGSATVGWRRNAMPASECLPRDMLNDGRLDIPRAFLRCIRSFRTDAARRHTHPALSGSLRAA